MPRPHARARTSSIQPAGFATRALGLVASVLAISLSACAHPAMQSEPAPLASDRPSFSSGTSIAQVGHPLLEAGMSQTWAGSARQLVIGEPTLRVGVTPRAELRITAPSFVSARAGGFKEDGLGDAALGAKIRLFETPEGASRIHPEIAVLAGVGLPTGSEAFGTDRALLSSALIASWSLSDRVGLGGNLIWAQADVGGSSADTYAAVAGLSFTHTDRLGTFVELYSTRGPGSDWDPAFGQYGVTWLWRPSVQLDAHAGVQLKDAGQGAYVGFGMTRRF